MWQNPSTPSAAACCDVDHLGRAETANSRAISMIGSGRPPSRGMKLVANRRSTEPMIYRARRMPRLEIRPSGRTPRGVFFICTKGGGGGAEPDPHTNHSRNFRLEDPPQFFSQIFWEKILEIKILAPLVTIFLATHAATPPATAPSLAQHIFCTQVGPPCLACLPTIHKL